MLYQSQSIVVWATKFVTNVDMYTFTWFALPFSPILSLDPMNKLNRFSYDSQKSFCLGDHSLFHILYAGSSYPQELSSDSTYHDGATCTVGVYKACVLEESE